MRIDVVMPQMGESIAEGTLVKWHKALGDRIEKDETLLEISTDKVDSEIPSPASGTLIEVLIQPGTTVPIKTLLAVIETEAGAAVQPSAPKAAAAPAPAASPVAASVPTPVAVSGSKRYYSPAVLTVASESGIGMAELERIPGTGLEGRVTKKDLQSFLELKKAGAVLPAAPSKDSGTAPHFPSDGPPVTFVRSASQKPTIPAPKAPEPVAAVPAQSVPNGGVEVRPMEHMRKLIAEHMVRSKSTSAHVYSMAEADMTRIVAFREWEKVHFEAAEGFKLTFTPFFVEATVRALKDFPLLNASIEGDNVLVKHFYNIGVAVALENGLIVPVVKNADTLNLLGIARAVTDLATRARNKKLLPDDVQGGTFSITNPGSFGNLAGFAIINQPQVAILGIGTIQKRPVVIDDAIAIRSMVYLTLSYDHRLVDGAMAGQFLQRVVQHLEAFDLNMAF